MSEPTATTQPAPTLAALLKPYGRLIATIVALTLAANSLNLLVPKLIARAIDTFSAGSLARGVLIAEFLAAAVGIFVFAYLQNVAQTFASERVARDLRTTLAAKLATQNLAYIQRTSTAKLLTNLTSDVDAVKLFISQAVAALVSSVFLILGASVLLLSINWKLGLAVLAVLPVIGVAFKVVLGRVRKLFLKSQQAIDWLNKVINESILGSALIRLLNSQHYEYDKFLAANTEARDVSLSILRLFASLIPIIVFSTNLATLMILTLGGHFVIVGAMSLGNFTAFNTYLAILIFPVILIGFMSNVMAQASASYARLGSVLAAPSPTPGGGTVADLRGDVTLSHVVVTFGEKTALNDVSLSVGAGTRTAVIGPTAAGKTQLLFLLTGLLAPTSGQVAYDGRDIDEYDKVDAAPAGRIRVSGRDHVQPDAAGEHRLQQDGEGRRPRESPRDGGTEGARHVAPPGARHRGRRARRQPVGRPETAHHAGAGARAQPARAAARRLHGPR